MVGCLHRLRMLLISQRFAFVFYKRQCIVLEGICKTLKHRSDPMKVKCDYVVCLFYLCYGMILSDSASARPNSGLKSLTGKYQLSSAKV